MMPNTDKFTVSPNHDLRCRTILKPYLDQTVTVIGILNQVTNNQDLIEYWQRKKNALIIEAHVIQTPETPFHFDLDLSHVHCQIQNQKLKYWQNQVITFSATVTAYETMYHQVKETRYGLTNFQMQPKNHAAIDSLNQYYQTKMTQYQKEIIWLTQNALKKYHSHRRLYSIEQIHRNLSNINGLFDQTQKLTYLFDKMTHWPHQWTNKQYLTFCRPTNADTKLTAEHQIKQYQSEILKLKQKNQNLRRQLQQRDQKLQRKLRNYQNLINYQTKHQPVSLWATLKHYFQLKWYQKPFDHQNDQKKVIVDQQVDPKKLAALQRKFNHK